ncbi:MAG: hypothetical protein JWP34_4827, partial [Massilia sp.]|nr:hypothetical protein [Massilia sp.]
MPALPAWLIEPYGSSSKLSCPSGPVSIRR